MISDRLARHDHVGLADGDRRRAAVAVVLVDADPADRPEMSDPDAAPEHGMEHLGRGTSFLLCRRASRLARHAGQWALPGGRVDLGESVEQCALRELDEEVGLVLGDDAVLGRLDDYPTRSGFVISPVVVWAGGRVSLQPHPGEVHGVYRIGLDELCREDSPRYLPIPESERPVVQLPLGEFRLHAPTAAVMLQFRWVALEGRLDERVDALEQPVWAWR